MKINSLTIQKIEQKITTGQIILPSMPNSIMQMRQVLDDPDASVPKITSVLATDPALAGRILKVANSALHRGNQEIENLHQAVNRLGCNLIKTLVTSHFLMLTFSQTSRKLSKSFKQLHQRSLEVAIYSYALARRCSKLNPEDALLAGLVHEVGYMPIIEQLESESECDYDLNQADEQTIQLKIQLGKKILQNWHFPESLIQVICEFDNLQHNVSSTPELVDIVTVAHLNAVRNSSHLHTKHDWHQVPAFGKLEIDPDVPLLKVAELESEILWVRHMLGV